MKKIFAILLALMICTMPLVAFAEDAPIVTEGVEGENSTTVEETPTEGEISAPETVPEALPTVEEEAKTVTDTIVKWIEAHSAELGIIVTLIGYGIVMIKKLGTVIKSASTMNNNAITMATTSKDFMGNALTEMQTASGAVVQYDSRIATLLEEFKYTAEDRARLETELLEIHKALKLAKEANVEFSNELADLIALANIPNFKKEEMGARHLAAVKAIAEADAKTETEEVKKDVGEEN
jgi:hypothetical protein